MNDPPSDINESIIDIFVLSVSETVTSLFTEHLEKKGYRVTLFTDGSYLLETIREGKPNLLICDTTTLDEEGFEVCRQIKADDDFWVIPVLMLTGGSTLTDLLRVLDCNADNFITHPFEISYCLSVIDSMLSIPVERQTPEQIKTQFKISHNDQIYVVAANRRKLLEFLLSSFEITVNQSAELSRIKSELQTLSESAINLEDYITGQTRVIDTGKASLQQKEQKISTLLHEVEEKKKILLQKSDEIGHLLAQRDEDKALIATYEDNLRQSIQERNDIVSSLQSEIDTLRKQVSALLYEVDITKTSLDTVQGELDDEKIHGTSLECTLELLVPQKDLAEKTLHALTLEYDQLKSDIADEKNRVLSAEQEIQNLMQAKTQAEQESETKISSLNEEIKNQVADLVRIKGQLEEAIIQRKSLENKWELLQQEKARSELSLQSAIESLQGQLDDLQKKYESASAALGNEENRTKSLEENLAEVVAKKEETLHALTLENDQLKSDIADEKNRVLSAEQEIQKGILEKTRLESSLQSAIESLQGQLDDLQKKYESASAALGNEENRTKSLEENLAEVVAKKEETLHALTLENDQLKSDIADEKNRVLSAEQEIQKGIQAKAQAEQELNLIIADLNASVKQQSLELTRLKSDLDEEAKKRILTENQAGAIRQEKTRSESSLQSAIESLRDQLDALQKKYESASAALGNEENRTKSLKENLADIIAEKEKTEEMLKTDRDSYKSTFLRLKHDLDEATAIPAALERELNAAKSQNKALTDELNLAYQGKAQTSQQVHSLIGELEQVKSALSSEQSLHRAGHEGRDADKQTIQRMEQELRKISDDRDSLDKILDNERRLRLDAEEKTKQSSQKQERIEQELKAITDTRAREENERVVQIQNLEKEFELVGDLQKSLEEQVNILKQEKAQSEKTIQALTNELNQARAALAEEWEDHMISVAAAFKERQRLQQGLSPTEGAGMKKEKTPETAARTPDLPVIVGAASHALVNVSPPGIQKSPDAENELVSPKTKQETSEISQEAVSAIVNNFCDDDLNAENELISPKTKQETSEISQEAVSAIVNNFCDDDLYEEDEPVVKTTDIAQGSAGFTESGPEKKGGDFSSTAPVFSAESGEMASSDADQTDVDEDDEEPGTEPSSTKPDEYSNPMSHGVFSFSRKQWFDLLKWARQTGTLSHDQRIQIVRMGRLIQKDRKLTKKQEEQVNEMIALVQALGYRPR